MTKACSYGQSAELMVGSKDLYFNFKREAKNTVKEFAWDAGVR